ncbi:MAG: ATP-binding protein [Thermodesulfobacteriota bacterium]
MWRLTALLLLVTIVPSFSLYHTWQKREEDIHARHLSILETSYTTTVHLYGIYSKTLYDEVINRPEILQIMAEAYGASSEQQAILRGRLYRLLYPSYNRLTQKNLRQLHFHFPDNTSFIRFHRLEEYDDNLTDFRESVRLVNATGKAIFGFENGKIYSGFRYVFPLQYQGKHVGGVETSISFKGIQDSMEKALADHTHLFIQKKTAVMAKALPSERVIYRPVALNREYVIEDLRVLGFDLQDPLFPLARQLNPIIGANRKIQEEITAERSFSALIRHEKDNFIITGIPIRNIKDEQVAYIISYEKDREITTLWNTYRYLILAQIIFLLILSWYIWRHRQTVSKLSNNESRLRAITAHMGESLYVNNGDGKIIFSNDAMHQQLGYSPAELAGKDAHLLLHRHKKEKELITLDECHLVTTTLAGETFKNAKDFFLHKNGEIIPVEVNATPLPLEQGQRGSVVIFRDISARLRAEAEQIKIKKLESIGVLAGGIAHDFNNLLTVIMGNLDIARLKIEKECPDGARILAKAQDATRHATRLTKQFLTFSKGGSPLTTLVDPGALFPEIVTEILSGTTTVYQLKFADNLWPVEIDNEQISLVIDNLLANAIQAVGQDGEIRISCRNEDNVSPSKTGKWVRLDIEDTGQGINEENLGKIFDPYFTTKEMGSDKGCGLGLSIVHSIMQKHNGFIDVASSEGKGTRVSIYLPAVTK